jgi:hypothetical protein
VALNYLGSAWPILKRMIRHLPGVAVRKLTGSCVFSPPAERHVAFAFGLAASWKFRSTLPKALKKRWKVPIC